MLKQAVFRPDYLDRRAARGTARSASPAEAGPVSPVHGGSPPMLVARRAPTTWWEEGWRLLQRKTGAARSTGWLK